jgi:hypothetical protein
VTGPKLLALADEMIRAQSDPANKPPKGYPPLDPDEYYPTRNVAPVIAIIYDWCYDQLGAARKQRMLTLMNAYYDDMRANAYQRNDHPDGNYFPTHMYAAATMGYATFGDNPRAAEMIAYARIRLDGTPSTLLPASDVPEDHFAQVFDGGLRSAITRDFAPAGITGAPFRSGFDFQGWGGYSTITYGRLIDYFLMVRSATGEDLLQPHQAWFSAILRAEKEAVWPNRFQIDPAGDWGGDYGAVVMKSLPLRLAYVLAGTPDGPATQHFFSQELASTSPYPELADDLYQSIYGPTAWEQFFFADPTRPSAELTLPPYYSGFGPAYPQGGPTNGAMPYFIMRSDWSSAATWASAALGTAWYNDHQHGNAGNVTITRGSDSLLVDAASWMGAAGSHGIVGGSSEEDNAAAANTLFFNDFGDYQRHDEIQYLGGQGIWGKDAIAAAEQNDNYTYVRSDLSTAYNRSGDPQDNTGRTLDHFYRSFLYLRPANVFVVFDQVQARRSTNRQGPYQMRLRWHFPNRPTLNGRTVQMDQGASRLYLDMVSPASLTTAIVDESHNPDRSIIACNNSPCDSGTWRLEVADQANGLAVPFLTVLQPRDRAAAPMTVTKVTSADQQLTGVQLDNAGVPAAVILLNNGAGATPSPITATSYTFAGPTAATQVLCGLAPNGRYTVSRSGATVSVAQSDTGTVTASPAGVLEFTLR